MTGVFRFIVISFVLDVIAIVAFLITVLISTLNPVLRKTALYSFTRNFSGAVIPRLDGRPVVWVHTNSVGEVLVCQALMDRLRAVRPDLQFVISIGTQDGLEVATKAFPDLEVFPTPFDFSWVVRRAFNTIRPVALLISENDFWPQMLFAVQGRNLPLAIFNTRMGPREQTEHRWNAWLLRPGLSHARWWGAVTPQDADWIRHFFGIDSSRIQVTGSLKWDGVIRDRNNRSTVELRTRLGFTPDQQVLIAGSTHSPEESSLIAIAKRIAADDARFRLVVVPRSASRGKLVAQLCEDSQIPYVLTSQLPISPIASTLVTIIDSIGLLRDAWGLANFAFVGGSLARHGGQNMIEPTSYGLPVCFGPHVWNFQSVAAELLVAQAAVQVEDNLDLENTIRHWKNDPESAQRLGRCAQDLVRARTEPLELTVHGILTVLPAIDTNRAINRTADEQQTERPVVGVS